MRTPRRAIPVAAAAALVPFGGAEADRADARFGAGRLRRRPLPPRVLRVRASGMRVGTRLSLALAVGTVVVLGPGVALAAWNTPGNGSVYVTGNTMPTGATPSVSVTGRNVMLTWSASSFPGGGAVGGYRIARYDAGTQALQTVGSSCSGTISALTCTEGAVPAGAWKYAVTPRHALWVGTEGAMSATATVASPSLTWTSPILMTSLPTILTGSLASYVTGETVTFRLDDPSTGTVLSASTVPGAAPASGAMTFSATIPAGTTNGSHTVYAVGSSGSPSSGGITVSIPDTTPPTVSAAVINKSSGDKPGYVKQGGTYYVYGSVTDPGAYATGVSTVTANVTNVTSGTTSAPMTAGSYTVGGVSYNYRTALLIASNPLGAGSKSFSITAVDASSNSSTQGGFSVTVDNTAPTGSDVQAVNGGGTAGKMQQNDQVVLTYSEPIDPNSILNGWNGSSTTISVQVSKVTGKDRITFWNGATQLQLGTVNTTRNDFITAGTVTFTNSTMVLSGSTVTITFGTPDLPANLTTAGGTGTMQWTPAAGATDLAGNACSTTATNETGAVDLDF